MMDPVNLFQTAYFLYERRINTNLKTVINNKVQFELLGQRIGDLAGPIKKIEFHKCTDSALTSLIRTLENVDIFVSQPRFQKAYVDKTSNLFLFISQMYHASEDNEKFVYFDKLLTNNLQSLQFGITVSILDYTAAAKKDEEVTFTESGLNSRPELREIDLAKLQWNPDSATDKLGQGAFSVVWKGQYDTNPVAIKQVLNLASLSPKDVRTITKEALLMQFSDHPNVLRVVGVCLPKGLLVMELALCSLSEYLYPITVQGEAATAQKAKLAPVNTLLKKLEVKWKLEVIQQLCDALQYLHRFHIMHRDIKSPNVMLFHDIYANKVIAKIGDFGLALAVDLITRTAQGTMMNTAIFQSALGTYNYMAPELFERQPGEKVAYSESSDVYSLGILINEIMSGAMPWGGGAREVDFMSWVVNKSMRPDVWIMSSSPTAAEKQLFAIVGRSDSAHPSCLHQSPSHRPTASEVCKAAYGSAPSLTAPTPPSSTKKGNVSTEKKVSTTTLQEGEIEVLIDDTIPITDADRPVIEAFAGELFIRLWHISESNAKRYAESLFQRNVANCGRFEQQLQSRSKLAPNGAVSWLQSQGFHEYDIDTVISNIAILQQVSN